MKKYFLIIAILFIGLASYAQETIKTPFQGKVSYSQKYGLSVDEGDHVLTVTYTEDSLHYNTREGQMMTNLAVAKKTDKYIICKDISDNYSFYDLTQKQLYAIDYFMSRYTVMGYGPKYTSIKQTVSQMMDKIKEGKSQKEVIKYLADQADYDF